MKLDAKREAIKALKNLMMDEMKSEMGGGLKEGLKGKMKMVVSSDSPEGLQKGLSLSQKLLKAKEYGDESPLEELAEESMEKEECEAECPGCPMCEEMEDESEEMEDDSESALDESESELLAKKLKKY